MRIAYSPRAVRDLAEIGDYLRERNPVAAAKVEQRIRTVVAFLANFPAGGQVLISRPAVRSMPLGNYPYQVFYTVFEDELIILHIRHGARRPASADEF